jgi:hypothetical protein
VASVVWKSNKLFRIALIRRSDAAVALVEPPATVRRDLQSFNLRGVGKNGMVLQMAVIWALPDAVFEATEGWGQEALRDGAPQPEFGGIRRFGELGLGIDLGEFELPDRCRLM